MTLLALVVAVVLAGLGWLRVRRRELFRIEVSDGRAKVARGRVPPGLLAELRGVVATPPVRSGTMFAFRLFGGARLYVRGDIDRARADRLRRLFSMTPMARGDVPVEPDRPSPRALAGKAMRWLWSRSRKR